MAKAIPEQKLKPITQQHGHVTLPFGQDDFKEFIVSLLGRPQSIRKTFSGCFSLDIDDLTNLHQLLEQRINQQNDAKMIQFTARIIFSDDSSVLLNSIEELETYNEVRPVVSTAIHMNWDYLVQFRGKKVPEKQNIQYSIVTTHRIRSLDDDDAPFLSFLGNSIDFNIKHTARTWGSDIEALLSNYTESILRKENKFKCFVRKHKGWISLSASSLFFVMSILTTFWATWRFSNEKMQQVNMFISSKQAEQGSIEGKINFLLTNIANGDWPQFYFKVATFLLFAIVGAFILGIWMEQIIKRKGPSFLLLTKESKKNKVDILKKDKHGWRTFIASIIVNIACGIVSSFIFIFIIS